MIKINTKKEHSDSSISGNQDYPVDLSIAIPKNVKKRKKKEHDSIKNAMRIIIMVGVG